MIVFERVMNKIKLSDFVKSTLIDIIQGVEEVKTFVAKNENKLDVLINPISDSSGNVYIGDKGNVRSLQKVSFDLLISANYVEENKGFDSGVSGKVSMNVLGFNFGLNSGDEQKTETNSIQNQFVNRIKFEIPICLGTNTDGKPPLTEADMEGMFF